VAIVLALVFLLANGVAFHHAWRMLHFADAGTRTVPPEQLTAWRKLGVLLTGVTIPKPRNERTPAALGLPFETRHLTTRDRVDLETWWIPVQESRGVVALFHGYAGHKSTMLEEAAAFREMGYSTLLVDHRGHGGSAGQKTSIGYHESADVEAAVEFARKAEPYGTIVLYGQSMGAVSIFRAVAVHRVPADIVIVEGIYDETLHTIRNRFAAMGVPSVPFAELLTLWGGVQNGFWAFGHNPARYANAVHGRALFLHGLEDPRASAREARRVFDRVEARKTWIEFAAGHEPLIRTSEKKWKRGVQTFLSGGVWVEPYRTGPS
jgi:pimeloyl-ACP methyl ester carboxylesterase